IVNMTLCSVFNCNEKSEKQSSSGVHFHVFPCRSKSPTRFRIWVNYCKRKNFNPGNGARICSKHFKSTDYNQSDLLRQKLMPNIKVKIKHNANDVPMVPQNIPSTSNPSNLSEREKRQSSKIIDFKITQKGMVQGDLEKKACELLLQKLEKNNECNINVFLTDRHKGIRCYIRTHHSNIEHEFDVWHLSKSLKTLEKNHHNAFMWKTSIINHLWWSAQTGNCNGTWNDNGQIKKCEHDPLTDEEIQNKLWISKNSDSYFALKKIITVKDLLKDLPHAKHFIHTGRLESYHNTRLKYMPKRIHLKYEGMKLENRIDIMNKVNLMAIEGSSGPLKLREKNLIPKNIVQTPKPDIEELKSKKYSSVKPYQFEPDCLNERDLNSFTEISDFVINVDNRSSKLNWCKCGQCVVMMTDQMKKASVVKK
ncbi:Uncharacterized protein FWK35_00034559, partial [Aphis craccivora]